MYADLIAWCKLPEHAEQTDDERLAALQARTLTRVISRFGSYRTIATVLTPEQYATSKTILATAAQGNPIITDMVEMLKLPGDSSGDGGGIDFGNATVRGMIDLLFSGYPEIAAALKSLGEEQVSQLDLWGLDIRLGNLASARQMIAEGA